jgi:hypothetical protein
VACSALRKWTVAVPLNWPRASYVRTHDLSGPTVVWKSSCYSRARVVSVVRERRIRLVWRGGDGWTYANLRLVDVGRETTDDDLVTDVNRSRHGRSRGSSSGAVVVVVDVTGRGLASTAGGARATGGAGLALLADDVVEGLVEVHRLRVCGGGAVVVSEGDEARRDMGQRRLTMVAVAGKRGGSG